MAFEAVLETAGDEARITLRGELDASSAPQFKETVEKAAAGKSWYVSTNTTMPSPQDIHPPGEEPRLADQGTCLVGGRSVVVLVGR